MSLPRSIFFLKNLWIWKLTVLLKEIFMYMKESITLGSLKYVLISFTVSVATTQKRPYRSPCSPFPRWPQGLCNNASPHKESSWSLCPRSWPVQSQGFSMYNQTWLQCYLVLNPNNRNKRRNEEPASYGTCDFHQLNQHNSLAVALMPPPLTAEAYITQMIVAPKEFTIGFQIFKITSETFLKPRR